MIIIESSYIMCCTIAMSMWRKYYKAITCSKIFHKFLYESLITDPCMNIGSAREAMNRLDLPIVLPTNTDLIHIHPMMIPLYFA